MYTEIDKHQHNAHTVRFDTEDKGLEGCKTKPLLIFSWIKWYFYAKGQVFSHDEGRADIKRAVRNNTLIDTA